MRKFLALCLSLFIAALPVRAAQETEYAKMSDLHKKVYKASLALYGRRDAVNISHFLCTATVVAERASTAGEAHKYEYLLLTAGHCVVDPQLPPDLTYSVAESIVAEDDLADRTPVEVLRAENDAKYDFAILYMKSDKEYPVIETAVRVPQIGDKVFTVNYSLGLAEQISVGEVATEPMHNTPDCDICEGRFMVHLFAGPGASGAAIVDEKTGEIVGVGELGFPGETVGLGCETTVSLHEWLQKPAQPQSNSPKAQALRPSQKY